jgi:hypothetical protein
MRTLSVVVLTTLHVVAALQAGTPAPTPYLCPTIEIMGIKVGARGDNSMGVYKLDSVELYQGKGASRAVYELIAYQRGIPPKRREPRFLYYMQNYKEWVVTKAVGVLPYDMATGDRAYAPYGTKNWMVRHKASTSGSHFAKDQNVKVVCIDLRNGNTYLPSDLHTTAPSGPPTVAPTTAPTYGPTVHGQTCQCTGAQQSNMDTAKVEGYSCNYWGGSATPWCFVHKYCPGAKLKGLRYYATCNACECVSPCKRAEQKDQTHGENWCFVDGGCNKKKISYTDPGKYWRTCKNPHGSKGNTKSYLRSVLGGEIKHVTHSSVNTDDD